VHSKAPHLSKQAALISLNRMMLMTSLGQYLDVQNPESEEAYWHLVLTKSSPFFGAALQVGALLAEASTDMHARQIQEIGHIYGEMIQIHDDLNDALAVPANQDWTLGRLPLPILYASLVNHSERERFLKLRNETIDPVALAEAQNILIRSGAVSYCIYHLFHKSQIARHILSTSSLPYPDVIGRLLDEIIDPVKRLMAVTGIVEEDDLLKSFPSCQS